MSDILACESCATQIDVSAFRPGDVVGCPSCGGKVTVPKRPATTRGSRRMPVKKKLPIGTFIGGGIALLVVIIAFVLFSGNEPQKPRGRRTRRPAAQPPTPATATPELPETPAPPPEPPSEPEEPPRPAKKTVETKNGPVESYVEFVPGAAKKMAANIYPPGHVDAEALEEARERIGKGEVEALVKITWKYYMPCLQLFLEDDEATAKGALEFINGMCVRYKVLNPKTKEPYELHAEAANSPEYRGSMYVLFLNFASDLKERMALDEEFGDPFADPEKGTAMSLKWDQIIRGLMLYQVAEDQRKGRYEIPEGSEGYPSFKKILDLDETETAYPYLIHFISSRDPGHRKAAIVTLNILTGVELYEMGRTQEDGLRIQKRWMEELDIRELPELPYD